ncbi:unnamed protein product [Orchesella dallaii]|uniref:F-box domain-containing protein n=1 Tax=Orchesella dallaii TaxID=48710 RepID=A0ABP1RI52_9HEXA
MTSLAFSSPESRDLDNNMESQRNPFLDHAILTSFFQSVPFDLKEFKNFRLVCKTWNQASIRQWRQKAWLAVRERSTTVDHSLFQLTLKQFLEMMEIPGDPYQLLGKNHYRRYKVKIGGRWGLGFCGKEQMQFWNNVGPMMTHLKIFQSSIKSLEDFGVILFAKTPNLNFLSLESVGLVYHYYDVELRRIRAREQGISDASDLVWSEILRPTSSSDVQKNLTHLEINLGGASYGLGINWMYLLVRFPNIKSIKLQMFSGQGVYRLFKSLSLVRANCGADVMKNLQKLDLLNSTRTAVGVFCSGTTALLPDFSFPITSLAVDIGVDMRPSRFQELLQLYSYTLRELVVYRGPAVPPFITFPFGVDLPHLNELRLIGPVCQDLKFLRDTPQLKVLVLIDGTKYLEKEVLHSYVDFSLPSVLDKITWTQGLRGGDSMIANTNFSGIELTSVVLPSMVEFVVDQELCNGDQVRELARMLPNIKRLRLGLGNDGFLTVCESWKQLEHLDIEPFDVDEEGILGVLDGQMYRQANLTDLKRLRLLRMGYHSQDRNGGHLTTNSILHGLLVAESLMEVSYAVAPKVKKKVKDMLDAKFPQRQ